MAAVLNMEVPLLDPQKTHAFKIPVKKINESHDLPNFLASDGYQDIITFLSQLNYAMFPRQKAAGSEIQELRGEALDPSSLNAHPDPTISNLQSLLEALSQMVDDVPPDPGPRRFGNISFRRWYELLDKQAGALLEQYLPDIVQSFKHAGDISPVDELCVYFLGSFGSAQRLDYGTGHELSFLAFLGGIWKLGGFDTTRPEQTAQTVVLNVIEP